MALRNEKSGKDSYILGFCFCNFLGRNEMNRKLKLLKEVSVFSYIPVIFN